ncbi:DUF2796 domain-containing protein [Vibrio aquaticus]|uniref:DUF2796 domain-containing protein n=1 Tax=Vibrio aquaticus TaxID=2496559 RepID=A0A432CVS3_9VIBR|nr:DUF2796 domain-containing protein [Vibrio aquaticus]RTZ14281.1 DUF2796 domain-containing protein [Vibrio aquaticus]
MNKITPIALGITLSLSGLAQAEEGFRQHSAHVHGEVEFNIAQDGNELLMEITAPGADVVGFEQAPQNSEQEHKLEHAVEHLNKADHIFSLTANAGCKVVHQSVSHTLGEDSHEGHDHHDDHKGHDHDKEHDHHDDHKGHDHDEEHDHHDDHKGHDHDKEHGHHDDHKGHDHDEEHSHHDDHKGHDHDEEHDHHDDHKGHDHDEHSSSHGEFTVEYHFECSDINKLEEINTTWFKEFPSTESIKVNVLTDTKQAAMQLSKGEGKISL